MCTPPHLYHMYRLATAVFTCCICARLAVNIHIAYVFIPCSTKTVHAHTFLYLITSAKWTRWLKDTRSLCSLGYMIYWQYSTLKAKLKKKNAHVAFETALFSQLTPQLLTLHLWACKMDINKDQFHFLISSKRKTHYTIKYTEKM